jgi:hypothetical protein
MEYFNQPNQSTGTVNDILKYYIEKYGKNNSVELKKVRHAIYQKADRLRKAGQIVVINKKGNTVTYGLPSLSSVTKDSASAAESSFKNQNDINLLQSEGTRLKYQLDLCIAEVQSYEDLKTILPNQSKLLAAKKEEARSRAIDLNGRLAATHNILGALTA